MNWTARKNSHIIGGDYIPLDKEQAEWVYIHYRKIYEQGKTS
jgi:hypothetical protein